MSIKITPKIKPKIQIKKSDSLSQWVPDLKPESKDNLVISFDVGIVNLAYCIMKLDNEKVIVYDWNIIKLVDGNPKAICCDHTKTGKKCTKKAYYTHEKKYYCKVHGCSSYNRNLTVENVTEQELKTLLFNHFDNNPHFLNVSYVLIEHQPIKAREKIKGIGHSIFDYFILRGTIDNKNQYKEIKFIDAKNKLTVYDGPPLSCHLKTQYSRNKWYSIEYCKWIIKDQNLLSTYFQNHGKKKDDLADCFLQGLWYLKFHITGIKAPMTSSHQKLVYRENNRLQYKKVRAYAPNKKAKKNGKYTLSNIKYMMKSSSAEDIKDPTLKTSIEYFFGDIEYFSGVLKNT